ncbi:MAG TPA: TetR/AcrR family transcriptional regulator [Firmicutes bacterium]|nr:TetR/AcrR family transcriptional regulator [Bacillota bacterium]
MEAKLTKRQLQAKKTQDTIYKTAVRLMQSKGFDNITIEEICHKAGVSVGSFYNRFKSKYDVLSAIFQEADNYFLQIVSAQIRQFDSSAEKILHFFKYYGDYNMKSGVDFVKHLFNAQNKMFTKGRPMQNVLQDIICQGQQAGEIRTDMTPEEISRYLFIAARGAVYDWCQHDGKYDLAAYLVRYMEMMLTSILTS